MKGFKNCLEFGKKYEIETLKYLDYDKYEISEGKNKEWDIKINKDNDITLYEVKAEIGCFKYNNLCIEYRCNNIDSGITATKAKWWIHYAIKDILNNLYIVFKIPTKKINEMIQTKKYNRIVKCGDNNNAECYLFKLDLFEEYKININN
jgi:hypothetical protein